MNNRWKAQRLAEIEDEIKKAESNKVGAIIMMVVSVFFLWPLLIVGGIMYSNANKKIEVLNAEKRNIMFMGYVNESEEDSD